MKQPEHIRFVLRQPINETVEEFHVWLEKIEDSRCLEKELETTIQECKEHYGEEFNQIFDEFKLKQLHENYLDICQWELKQSIENDY